MSQSYTGVKGTPFSDLVFFRRAGKPGFATAGDDRGDKARGTGPRRGPPPRGRINPEFYVEKPNKLIALTIATLNAGISIGIAASLAGSLIALHARGGPGDLATTKPCPNSEYGILAFCIAAAILGTSYISAAVVRRAKPIHAELMRIMVNMMRHLETSYTHISYTIIL